MKIFRKIQKGYKAKPKTEAAEPRGKKVLNTSSKNGDLSRC